MTTDREDAQVMFKELRGYDYKPGFSQFDDLTFAVLLIYARQAKHHIAEESR